MIGTNLMFIFGDRWQTRADGSPARPNKAVLILN